MKAGDVIWVDLDPVRGTEQAGVRPALVVSDDDFNAASRIAIICPITSNTSPWPTKVLLPEGLPVRGAILAEQVRAVDRQHRGFRFLCRVPDDVLREVRLRLGAVLQIGATSPGSVGTAT